LQASVLYEVKDIHKCPGWMEALKSNREMGGTLRLPIFMQGDRIYWGQVRLGTSVPWLLLLPKTFAHTSPLPAGA
jgi:hypothetical protein